MALPVATACPRCTQPATECTAPGCVLGGVVHVATRKHECEPAPARLVRTYAVPELARSASAVQSALAGAR